MANYKKEVKALRTALSKRHGKLTGRNVGHLLAKLPESTGLSHDRMNQVLNSPPEDMIVQRQQGRIEVTVA